MPDNASGLGNSWKLQECGGEMSLPLWLCFSPGTWTGLRSELVSLFCSSHQNRPGVAFHCPANWLHFVFHKERSSTKRSVRYSEQAEVMHLMTTSTGKIQSAF